MEVKTMKINDLNIYYEINDAEAAQVTGGYTVKDGDTLFQIAENECGDGNLYPAIAEANGISAPYLITPGQELEIPCA